MGDKMLLIYDCIEKLKKFLDKFIKYYKIIINTDTTISLRLVCEDDEILKYLEDFCDIKIYIEEIYSLDEYKNDEFLQKSLDNNIDWSFKKRFDSFNYRKKIDIDIPIVSFYSYKGGVGRTTSLVAFAAYYSNIAKKNVVILDFDFEAPGVINFFNIDFEKNSKNGIIEFILDSQATKKDLKFNNYYIEVSKKFSGEGNIYIIPAGNVFDLKNIKSYIEGLSRIDINSAETILSKLKNIILKIKEELRPDVILIDSRTGFNDVFGLLSYSLSDLIVGFFTNNKQNKPGLEIFLDIMQNSKKSDFILINSQIHFEKGFKKRFESFKDQIYGIVGEKIEELPISYLERVAVLIDLGSEEEDLEEFIEFIKRKYELVDSYKYFFELIRDFIENKNLTNETSKNDLKEIIHLKKNLLTKLQKNYPKLYAEDTIYDEKFLEKDFYIRQCMEDFFNFDKFLLIGGKGSGKTAFYNALKNEIFVDILKRKANKYHLKTIVIDIISLRSNKNKKKYFPLNEIKDFQSKDDRFYKRFWKVYILNSLALEEDKLNGFKFSFNPIEFSDKNTAQIEEFIEENIKNFAFIEEEFNRLDDFLKKEDINLFLTFDQLDFIVSPNFWYKGIVPLIDFAKTNSFFKIYPKLFLRRDLFEKLSNIVNKESLRDSNSINLEWTKDEIFGFFFKVVFAYTKDEFFKIMELYRDNAKFVSPIKSEIKKNNKFNQIPLEKYYILPLIETFFGKYAYVGKDKFKQKKFGLMYDWFYNNLKNADDTISLRPFLDLIKEAIKRYLQSQEFEQYEKPILPAKFHTNKDVRKIAVKRHFEDLASEAGNENFKIIIEHIKNESSKFPNKFRKRILEGGIYEEFLRYFYERKDELGLNIKHINEIEETLKINGVIRVEFIKSNYKKVEFAYLYKYYLGLKG